VLTTLVAVGLAWRGVTLWALLSTDLVSALLSIVLLYLWKPVWRPRLVWAPAVMLYFIRFGSRQFVVNTLSVALDRLDDLWTRVFLGSTPLGLYSRAYALATYPRQILAVPINAVTVGTFAELKEDRFSLSRAFFRANAALVYTGFLMSGLLILTAPEIIRLLLGVKWLPMLITFRLMLIFTLLDPLRGTSVNLFVAVGKPEQIGKVQLVQLASLLIGLFFLAPRFGINGVAVAVDAMLVIGIVLMLWHARAYVDFSLTRLFAGPGLALIGGLALGRGVIALPGVAGSDWRTGILKAVVFGAVYAAVLVATGRRQLYESLAPFVGRALNAIRKQPAAGP
jgi:lipopolysaccharide exporter